jgi:hypothetical protein
VTCSNGACGWTSGSSDPSWLHITASGTGSGTAGFTADANTGLARSATLTIAGQTFTVTQANGCTYSLSSGSASVGSGAYSGSVNVTCSNGACGWTSGSSDPSWLHITASGTGSGTAGFTADANTGPARSATLTIAGQTFTVTQASGCTYSITPSVNRIGASGGTGSVSVSSGPGCGWTATSNAAWITITGGSSGSGNGTAYYSVAASSSEQRSGTITIAGSTFTINQPLCQEACTGVEQQCISQVSSGCPDMCYEVVWSQMYQCVGVPGLCEQIYSGCMDNCAGQAQATCAGQYSQCMATCN